MIKTVQFFFSATIILVCGFTSPAQALTKVRIGWQIPWATQGQLVQILKKTDILSRHGLEAEFLGRTAGPQLNELALSGAIDIVLTGDLPGLVLISKNKGWRGIGRLMYNRTATYVPPSSPLKSMMELKGKTIAFPFGTAAERVLTQALGEVGLTPQDVTYINQDIREQGVLINKSQGQTTFEQFDALAGFDPTPAIFETQNLVRVLHTGRVVSLVIMNQDFLTREPAVGTQVIQALRDAYDYYRQNVKQANTWFMDEAQLPGATDAACNLAASLEPNLKVNSVRDIRMSFTSDDMLNLQKAADFLRAKSGVSVDVSKFIDNTHARNLN